MGLEDMTDTPPTEAGWYWVFYDRIESFKTIVYLDQNGRWYDSHYADPEMELSLPDRFGSRIPSSGELVRLEATRKAADYVGECLERVIEMRGFGHPDEHAALCALQEARGE